MKFWKILRNLINQTLPDWKDKFLSYKELKQHLNLIYPNKENDILGKERPNKRPRTSREHGSQTVLEAINEFLNLLHAEIDKFNKFVMNKEEGYIIKLQMLKDDVVEARCSTVELMKIGRKMVDFHGEMILLENYSALNYIGLVKILKKHDKRSNGDHLIRLGFVQIILQQPFLRTQVIKDLVKECESMIIYHILSGHQHQEPAAPSICRVRGGCVEDISDEELGEMENMYLRLTISALRALKKIRSGSSTLGIFSMPPMKDCDHD
ncbi:SPX domain-containing protein 1-like [Primulina tabacum]|uniref:SPX domain-containing protein 1-like n=1 Tax=Primulina tabacum TaxID=48773 RepID=UPI003F5ACB97